MGKTPTLADLVPRNNSAYWFILAGGVTVIAILGGLYALGLQLAPLTTDGKVAAFDLDSEGSIGNWFSVVLLFLCGQTGLLVRRLRDAAGDASRGERVGWLAVSLVWFIMSLDEGASLHEGFKEMMAKMTGTRIFGDGSIYWVVPYFVALSACGLFLLWSARRTPAAIACLFSTGICYGLAVLTQMDLILRGRVHVQIWLEESCEMLGDLFFLLTIALHARCVVQAAENRSTVQHVNSSTVPRLSVPASRTIIPASLIHRN